LVVATQVVMVTQATLTVTPARTADGVKLTTCLAVVVKAMGALMVVIPGVTTPAMVTPSMVIIVVT
jgi:hypothetical protein